MEQHRQISFYTNTTGCGVSIETVDSTEWRWKLTIFYESKFERLSKFLFLILQPLLWQGLHVGSSCTCSIKVAVRLMKLIGMSEKYYGLNYLVSMCGVLEHVYSRPFNLSGSGRNFNAIYLGFQIDLRIQANILTDVKPMPWSPVIINHERRFKRYFFYLTVECKLRS